MRRFVALDLELTPYPGNQQRIIEVAAVSFVDQRIADQFTTLVDPRCDVSRRVEALTGISGGDVRSAPRLQSVLPDLLDFIGDAPIVGQSIDLDLAELSAAGVQLSNPAYDTYELASLLLPGLPTYDLQRIAAHLGVPPERSHRALSDAIATGWAFLALLERARGLSLDVLTSISSLSRAIPDWPYTHLFEDLQRLRLRQSFASSLDQSATPRPSRQVDPALPQISLIHPEPEAGAPDGICESTAHPPRSRRSGPVDNGPALRSLLVAGGAVASALPGFEERKEQVRMMEAVASALEEGRHLLVEAGTGTGKSIAYLLPAIYSISPDSGPVVVSTNTINLQDQLYHKDIPLLQRSLPFSFKATLVKGRNNYLCLRRWLVLTRSPELSSDEARLLMKVAVWLTTTTTGDKSELNLSGSEAVVWPRVSAHAESCALARCPHFRKGSCFVTRVRREAEKSDVIVVNHSLLLTDTLAASGILPEYSRLIIDEAHHLEEEATDQLGFSLDRADLLGFLAGLFQAGLGPRAQGFLPELASGLRLPSLDRATVENARGQITSAVSACESASAEARAFFDALMCFLQEAATDRYRQATRLRITSSTRVQPGWSEIEVTWSSLSERLTSLLKRLMQLHQLVSGLEDHQILERDGLIAEMAGHVAYLEHVCEQGAEAVCAPGRNGVYWIESGLAPEDLTLRSAPLHVGEALERALFSCKESVVLTSATLTTEGSFDFVKERLGLESADELVVGSPFDYRRSTLLYVARDIPEPARPAHQRAIESAIADLATAMEGRTLVLFTSHSQLRATNAAIRERLEREGLLVLAHGVDGSRRRLLQSFACSPKAILLGTSSFWEGIDVVGQALSCLVIVKLPFAVPSDPVFAARSEGFDDPFRQYSLPQTILKFKQGFGRLIRSRSDRGVVAILDSRIGSKFYGPAFLHSLPACTVRYGPAAHLGHAARQWLGAIQTAGAGEEESMIPAHTAAPAGADGHGASQ